MPAPQCAGAGQPAGLDRSTRYKTVSEQSNGEQWERPSPDGLLAAPSLPVGRRSAVVKRSTGCVPSARPVPTGSSLKSAARSW